MPAPRFHPTIVVALLIALLMGVAALAYARWLNPLLEAERALDAGRIQEALAAYAGAERRVARFDITRRVFAGEHTAAVFNQLALLYQAGAYDAVIAKAADAPAGAAPRFWSGTALLAQGLAQTAPEARLVWLTRAEDELKQALQDAPQDWDARFNYELAARLAADLRGRPRSPTDTRMQLLRPQQPQPKRRAG